MKAIEIEGVSKRYPNGVLAVDDVSLDVAAGEFIALVGPSGCGKTTLLRMLAGLESVTHGSIRLDGIDITREAPQRRDIAMVFQDYALYPEMTVAQNLSFGLKLRKTPKAVIAERVDEVAAVLGLQELLDRRPAALSGGQRQRVALGRAIVREPAAFLMDEPLSNLDAKLRVAMRAELARLHARLRTTTIYVTHDQAEAMTLGHRVAVLNRGRILQCAPPREIFTRPANVFVAAFMGSPPMNLFAAVVEDGGISLGALRLPVAGIDLPRRPVDVGIRPSAFRLARPDAPGAFEVRVDAVEDLGDEVLLGFYVMAPPAESYGAVADVATLGEARLIADQPGTPAFARVSARSRVDPGAAVHLQVEGDLYFFDQQSGECLGSTTPVPEAVAAASHEGAGA